MGKKSKPPKGPDWNRLIQKADEYQAQNQQIFDDYMAFQKGAYGDQKAIQDQIAGIALPAMEDEANLAQTMRDNYREMGIPFEKDYVNELQNWDTAARRDQRAGEAQAGIGLASDAARESELRRLEGYGIDPSQTRSAALDSRLRLAEAVTKAAAGNQQRRAVEQEGLQYGATAIDIMRGWPQMSQQSLQTGLGAGAGALQGQQAVDKQMGASYPTGANILGQGYNAVQGAYGTGGNLNQNDLARYEMNQKYNNPWSGIGSLIGTGLSAAGAAGGFGNLFGGFFAEGGPMGEGAQPMAAPRNPQSGIPAENVPAMLSPGEFVIPDDVARWEGEKNLQKIINKAREDKAKTDQQRASNQMAMGIPA